MATVRAVTQGGSLSGAPYEGGGTCHHDLLVMGWCGGWIPEGEYKMHGEEEESGLHPLLAGCAGMGMWGSDFPAFLLVIRRCWRGVGNLRAEADPSRDLGVLVQLSSASCTWIFCFETRS